MSLIKAKTSVFFGQYDKAVKYFKKYLTEEPCAALSGVELDMFSNAYNNIAQDKRNYIMELDEYVRGAEDCEKQHVSSMRDETRTELIAICADVVDLIDRYLLRNLKISQRELVFVYKIKGDFLRFMWESDSDENTCDQATKAYYEAMSICQWNYEPTDVYLLQVTMNYTVHLKNANSTDLAIVILKSVINNALEEGDKNGDTKTPLTTLLLNNLNENLEHFQEISREEFSRKIEELRIDVNVDEHLLDAFDSEEELTDYSFDDVTSRRRG